MARRKNRLPLHLPYFQDIHTSHSVIRLEPETDESFTVVIDGMESSNIHPDPTSLSFEYMRWIHGILEGTFDRQQPLAIAHLGGGAAALARALAHTYPASTNHVVELDDELIALVRQWVSDLPPSPRVALRHGDAFEVLHTWRSRRFDVLIRDTFSHARTPTMMRSIEAAQQAARVLTEGGMFIANAAIAPDQQELADEIVTLREVFGRIHVVTEPSAIKKRRRSNALLIAGRDLSEAAQRALRSDPVRVHVLEESAVDRLARPGRVTRTPRSTAS